MPSLSFVHIIPSGEHFVNKKMELKKTRASVKIGIMFIDEIRKTIVRYNLVSRNHTVLIGVSGGPDSVALLYALKALQKEFKIKLHIAHLDHMLRKDSQKDSEFVGKLAGKLKLPVTIGRINVNKSKKKGSTEEAARNARFRFLCGLAYKIKADRIALGHNLDDQAETVLMRLLRGTGLYGLSGILPKRKIYGFTVIRPLIETRRKDIRLFLRKRNVIPRHDPSNKQNLYFRNRIRNKLLPLLKKNYNTNIKEVLSNFAQSSGYDYDYLRISAERAMKRLGEKISLTKFLRMHPAAQRMVLRLKILQVKGDLRKIDFAHIKEIEDLIHNRPENSIVDLPKGVSIKKRRHKLVFYLRTVRRL